MWLGSQTDSVTEGERERERCGYVDINSGIISQKVSHLKDFRFIFFSLFSLSGQEDYLFGDLQVVSC